MSKEYWTRDSSQDIIREFINYLPQRIYGISEVISASYDASRNTVTLKNIIIPDKVVVKDTARAGNPVDNKIDLKVHFFSKTKTQSIEY